MIYGYARVSTDEQDVRMQYDILLKNGCNQIIVEKASGAKFTERPQLQMLLESLKEGDTLIVYRLDRLARCLKHLMDISELLSQKKVIFKSICESIDCTTANGKMMFGMFAIIAEFERNVIVERSKLGLQAAKARGMKLGRKPALENPTNYAIAERIKRLRDNEGKSFTEISEIMRMNRTSCYRYYYNVSGIEMREKERKNDKERRN